MRTPEQIRKQLEAQMDRLEKDYETAAVQYPCKRCRWGKDHSIDFPTLGECHNPLIFGFSPGSRRIGLNPPSLCGPERALWEPKGFWAMLKRWFK